jgi:hypothetical protein
MRHYLLYLYYENPWIRHDIERCYAFNIQFVNGKPLFIDTLSFDRYDENCLGLLTASFAKLFCFPIPEHYLKIDCIKWLSNYIHGIPVEVTLNFYPEK